MAEASASELNVVPVRQTRRTAATDRWYLWTIAVAGLFIAVYFYTHPEIWTMQAERFYVLIFGGASFLAAVAGAYRIYNRPTYHERV
ncbi:MAG: hypothetical protein V5A62_08395 [Haloarculaceae archaeon]